MSAYTVRIADMAMYTKSFFLLPSIKGPGYEASIAV